MALAGCGGGGEQDGSRFRVAHFVVDSRLVGRPLEQAVIHPGGTGRPLLVLLHGAGAGPDMYLDPTVLDAVRALGDQAPLVVLVEGGGVSYFHDRREGRWGSYVLDEVIPQAAARYDGDPDRVAIGGISMGGFGALDLGRLAPDRFCAVGGHSPALFASFYEAPGVAFDDLADFDRHDLFTIVSRVSSSPYGRARVWIDVGREDAFLANATTYAGKLRARGVDVTSHVWPGGHESAYWGRHMGQYLRFYADALAAC
jgi:S-formylglutathione hydrolase FrmB